MHPLDALGNPVRRKLLLELRRAPLPVEALADRFPVSRPAISRHLKVLQQAGLVEASRQGAQNVYTVRLQAFQGVRAFIDQFWDVALAQLEKLAERRR
jgi:DNA-binding transcriptional ArsR family regulator